MEAPANNLDPKALDQQIGRRVRDRRDHLGWSQKHLADKVTDAGLKLNSQVIYNIEAGNRSLKLSEAHTVATQLGVPVEDLLPGSRPNAINRNWIRAIEGVDSFRESAQALMDALDRLQADIDNSVQDREDMFGVKGPELRDSYHHTLTYGAPARVLESLFLDRLWETFGPGDKDSYFEDEADYRLRAPQLLSEKMTEALEATPFPEDKDVDSLSVDDMLPDGHWWMRDSLRFASVFMAVTDDGYDTVTDPWAKVDQHHREQAELEEDRPEESGRKLRRKVSTRTTRESSEA